ncbi:MAG: hypothetical protein A2452_13270 [Candidatus Firestonebacteria bacterium RIFOXYC2_FULL_39_67]|nr:MAG: hypothetical protein A2536_01130 [Candidatus Firestonebacteria bacterium RIFOXYD2_FULL_39_29]OGF53194.1 MAG: hypothetical protein A2497_01810 [Candidatus Firestonebacteria bacterium RifOxyC12_full_39_7]OGF56290.1 MAG: hypothetical protein A2452_13270 [Candidatus Firestonebacteria bacterium RIFOXYC2_FULL_39_67]
MASVKYFDSHFHVWDGNKGKIGQFIEKGQVDGMNLILAAPDAKDIEGLNEDAFTLKKKYGKRIQLAYWVNPLEKGSIKTTERFFKKHPEITGIKIHPCHYKPFEVSEKIVGPILDFAKERDLYVITHTQPTRGQSAIAFRGVLGKRQNLRFILGHGSTIEESVYMAGAFKNCYIEPSWLGFFSLLFEMAERVGGFNKLLVGTDGPIWFSGCNLEPFEDTIQLARKYLPSMKEVKMFCYDNAASFFRLNEK